MTILYPIISGVATAVTFVICVFVIYWIKNVIDKRKVSKRAKEFSKRVKKK